MKINRILSLKDFFKRKAYTSMKNEKNDLSIMQQSESGIKTALASSFLKNYDFPRNLIKHCSYV